VCSGLIGTTLEVGEATTCDFTLADYTPAPGVNAVDRVRVKVVQPGNPGNSASDIDTSSVNTRDVTPSLSVVVVKTNDANRDDEYSDTETAPFEAATVSFRAVITNTSSGPVVITELTDGLVAPSPDSPVAVCASLVGGVLRPGEATTCDFTLANYSPPPGVDKIDKIVVVVAEPGDGQNTASGNDQSTVRSLDTPPPALSVDVVKTNDANDDGSFNDAEVALDANRPVKFRVRITNTSSIAVEITSVTDEVISPNPSAPGGVCPGRIGDVLQPGESTTCDFTINGYAPAAGVSKVNRVVVKVVDADDATNIAEDFDTSTVASPEVSPALTFTVEKTNDADNDGVFNDSETTGVPGQSVVFRAVITNTSAIPVAITELTDEFPGSAPADVCGNLLGTTLDPGRSAVCIFTIDGYTPPAGDNKVNTVRVVVEEPGNPSNTASNRDSSTVVTTTTTITAARVSVGGTASVGSIARGVLPFTGSPIFVLAKTAGWLLAGGLLALGVSRIQRRRSSRSTA
jgi:hypothetical protein